MSELTTAETPEQWQAITGYENFYQVSNHGQIRSLERITTVNGVEARREPASILNPSKHHLGYLRVNLVAPGQPRRQKTVRALVAEAFHGPRPARAYVVHIDGNLDNCRADNLAYMTPGQSTRAIINRGTGAQYQPKNQCKRGHSFTAGNVKEYDGRRYCMACNNTHSYLRRHPEERDRFQEIADYYYKTSKAKP